MARWDEDGFSSCSTCPCHRAALTTPPEWQAVSVSPQPVHAAFAPPLRARPPELFFLSRPPLGSLPLRPVTRSPSPRWLGRSASSVSFPPRMRPKLRRFLTFPPVRLTLTEHVCLVWTHKGAQIRSRCDGVLVISPPESIAPLDARAAPAALGISKNNHRVELSKSRARREAVLDSYGE